MKTPLSAQSESLSSHFPTFCLSAQCTTKGLNTPTSPLYLLSSPPPPLPLRLPLPLPLPLPPPPSLPFSIYSTPSISSHPPPLLTPFPFSTFLTLIIAILPLLPSLPFSIYSTLVLSLILLSPFPSILFLFIPHHLHFLSHLLYLPSLFCFFKPNHLSLPLPLPSLPFSLYSTLTIYDLYTTPSPFTSLFYLFNHHHLDLYPTPLYIPSLPVSLQPSSSTLSIPNPLPSLTFSIYSTLILSLSPFPALSFSIYSSLFSPLPAPFSIHSMQPSPSYIINFKFLSPSLIMTLPPFLIYLLCPIPPPLSLSLLTLPALFTSYFPVVSFDLENLVFTNVAHTLLWCLRGIYWKIPTPYLLSSSGDDKKETWAPFNTLFPLRLCIFTYSLTSANIFKFRNENNKKVHAHNYSI